MMFSVTPSVVYKIWYLSFTFLINKVLCLFVAEHLPQFPVQQSILSAIKERVNLARDLDRVSLQVRKGNFESNWFQKAADDMDIILDDRYPF